jgi:hypothetical protein
MMKSRSGGGEWRSGDGEKGELGGEEVVVVRK